MQLSEHEKGDEPVKSKRLLMLTGILLMMGTILAGCSSTSNEGIPASDFTLPDLDGEQTSLSDFKGRPVLLTFWRINCTYCREQMPHLNRAYEEYASMGLMVLEVNTTDSSSRVQDFVADYGVSVPVLVDGGEVATGEYRIMGVPTNFLIDRQGVIQEKRTGPFTSYDDLRESLQKIL